jgi:hypothetical protein
MLPETVSLFFVSSWHYQQIKWWQYIVVSAVGIVPGSLLYTYLGSVAGDLSDIIRGQSTTLSLTTQIIIWTVSGGLILTVCYSLCCSNVTKELLIFFRSEDGYFCDGDGETSDQSGNERATRTSRETQRNHHLNL